MDHAVNWEAISAIGQIVGAIAVVISLIYLARQVGSSVRETRLSSMRSTLDFLNRLNHRVTAPACGRRFAQWLSSRWSYFVLNYVGEQGTAKSCTAKIQRQLIDPNENPLRSPPKEERDLLVQAASNRCVALDNLSSLPLWLSDGLCRLSTGGGHSARELYTDLEEISIAVKRPVILNGIEDVATRPILRSAFCKSNWRRFRMQSEFPRKNYGENLKSNGR